MNSATRTVRFGAFVTAVGVACLLLSPFGAPMKAQSSGTPALPSVTVDTTYAAPSTVVNVPSGSNLQTAINNAALGTTLMLQAGGTYGAVDLPNKSGSGWIYIVSNGILPAQGNRVQPAQAGQLAKIQVSTNAAITTSSGAHHYRFVGIEVSLTGTFTAAVVDLGNGAHHIILDRCYVHGTSSGTHRRGITLHGAHLAVVDSYVADFHENGADSQAIASWDGTGPLKIQNTYASAAGENILFGGADPSSGIGPSDIELRGNYLFKPTSWQSSSWTIKNLIEFKNARRVLAEGNVLENNWAQAQAGFSILITPRNQDGSCPGCGTQDITFRLNSLINSQQGINISGEDDVNPSTRTARVLIQDNSFGVCCVNGSDGRGFQTLHGPVDVVFERNTWPTVGTQSFHENSPLATGFVFRNNVIADGAYGLSGTNTPSPQATLTGQFASPIWTGNALVGASSAAYSSWPGNTFPSSVANPPAGVGVNVAALTVATTCAVSGLCAGASSGDTTPPTASMTAPAASATLSGTVTVSANASDNTGVVGVQFRANGTNIGVEDTTAPYSISWNSASLADGAYSITAVARDAAGNSTTSSGVAVTISNAGPVVSITAPAAAAALAGTVTVSANATDASGVAGVQFKANGTNIGAEDTTAPYSISWNSASVADGSYTITAVARDTTGNSTTSAGVAVSVSNSGPTVSITAPAAAAVLASTVTVSATASDANGVAGVQFKANGTNIGAEDTTAPYSINWNTASVADGAYTITAVARDTTGNITTSSGVAVNVTNSGPTVSVTAPAAAAVLLGSVTVSATASDDTGVVGVQFKANGTNIGAEDTTAPYSISWNTTSVADGAYTITAVARDTTGISTTSSGVAVIVSNAGPAVSGVTASALTATSVTINWTTNQASDSQVDFGVTTTYGSSTALDTALVTSHSQSLTGLTSATVYHYRVRSQNAQSQETISGDFTFTTVGASAISGVAASATTATTATIVWTTSQAADSQVEYGLTTAYGSASALNASLVTSHSQTLTGLTSNQTYHYRVRSTNSFGLTTISGDFTFVPVAAANISGVNSSAVTGSTASIAWATDIASDSQVDYGTTTAYGSSTSINTAMVTSHSQNLSGLANGTLYHYRAKSRNSQAALATSGDFTFTTVAAPSISGVAVSAITGNTATISWTTNQSADSQVDYGTTTTYGTQSALDSALVTSHSQNLAGLAPGTLYHYRVRARNSSSLLSTSADGTFTTVAAAAISGVSASAVKGTSANINWTTNQSSDSQVEYGPTTGYGSSTTLAATMVTGHTQGLSGLAQGTLYHYRVKSRNNVGLLATSGDFTFTTDAAPSISNVRVGNKNHKSATIAWNTNQTSDSVVDYGTTAAYGGTTALDSTMVTGHSRLVDNLAPSTTYHYRVRSTNASSLEAASGDFTFTTDSTPTQTYSVVVSTSNTATGTGAVIAPVAGITCGASCSGSVNSGTAVVFTAVPGTASRFAGWGGACIGSLVTCTVNVTDNTTVSATFAPSTTGDFDGDGFADLVWQHTDGTLALWTMQGNNQASSNYLTPLVTQSGIDWQIIGPGSGSGGEDPGTGGSGGLGGFVHPTGGAGVLSAVYLTAQSKIVDLGWHIVATPDLNRDGRADLLWQHSVTGKLAAWTMDGAVKTFGAFLTPDTMDPALGWTIRTTADFNNDGKPDIVWQRTNGSLLIWFMDGLIKTGEQTLSPSSVSAQWTLAGSGDFDSDGQADLVWQNQATGDVYLWLMNGTSMRQEQAIGQLGAGWMVRAVGDFDGDGRPDLIWQKTTGELAAWFMNGTAIKSSVALNPGSVDPAWMIVGIK